MTLHRSIALCAALLLGAAAHAAEPLTIEAPQVRLVPPSAPNSAVFMTLRNAGLQPVKLIGAASPAAEKVELHDVIRDGEVMRMRPVPHIEVPARGEVVLKPGGYHVMLLGLKQPLQADQQVPVTLQFDDGSSHVLQVPVRPIAIPMHGQ